MDTILIQFDEDIGAIFWKSYSQELPSLKSKRFFDKIWIPLAKSRLRDKEDIDSTSSDQYMPNKQNRYT